MFLFSNFTLSPELAPLTRARTVCGLSSPERIFAWTLVSPFVPLPPFWRLEGRQGREFRARTGCLSVGCQLDALHPLLPLPRISPQCAQGPFISPHRNPQYVARWGVRPGPAVVARRLGGAIRHGQASVHRGGGRWEQRDGLRLSLRPLQCPPGRLGSPNYPLAWRMPTTRFRSAQAPVDELTKGRYTV